MPKDLQRKYRTQKYRREWETESWAHGWLSVSKKNNLKAYCCFCDKELVVGKSELLCHSKTNLHMRNAKLVISAVSVSVYFEHLNSAFHPSPYHSFAKGGQQTTQHPNSGIQY